ncbi:hypothetical protein Uis1B_2250 [Bifidobacterium margollesii]|uniref:Uncharacterized protein n=1 Tax=Bifidobacterium margollesii TaxID=2020964 RepID=A0A2N5J6T2_9BIFI|nr:hypothetical protein [Bifidobacterium margollesii]PLS29920.1 hypothetical protein Uis1B_2250 [Bifidobacterium margollesii]
MMRKHHDDARRRAGRGRTEGRPAMRDDPKPSRMPDDRRHAVLRTTAVCSASVVCCALLGWSAADHDPSALGLDLMVSVAMATSLALATLVGTVHRYFVGRSVKGVEADQWSKAGERERRWRERRLGGVLLWASCMIAYMAGRILTIHGLGPAGAAGAVATIVLLAVCVRAVVRMLLMPMLDPNQNQNGGNARRRDGGRVPSGKEE